MSSTNNSVSYSFTQYITAKDVAKKKTFSRTFDETNSGDGWKLGVEMESEGCDICLTLTKRDGIDCSFAVKLSLLDENRQAKLELVKRGWKYCGLQERFLIPYELLQELTKSSCRLATINVTIIKIPEPLVARQLLDSFRCESFGDVEIECADRVKLYCHKGILANKSVVFLAMFNLGRKESVENRFRIEDFSSDVIAVLRRFVYRGDWGDLSGVADGVYKAADQYQLEQLKMAAKAELIVNLNADSIVSTFRLAQLYKDKLLEDGCVDYRAFHKDSSLVEVVAEAESSESESSDSDE